LLIIVKRVKTLLLRTSKDIDYKLQMNIGEIHLKPSKKSKDKAGITLSKGPVAQNY